MARAMIYEKGFKPQFSGHETFPLRYPWLKKVFDAVTARASDPNNKSIFNAADAISMFGVGKNMVTSMRYWALAARIIEDSSGNYKGPYQTLPVGDALFGRWDPYLEEPASLWWLHWQFASNALPTTMIYFVFNHFHSARFYRPQLNEEIRRYCEDIGYTDSIALITLERDVDCFLRTYVARAVSSEEDSLDSLMAELALIRPIGTQDGFVFARGAKPSLPDAIFLYALTSFALQRPGSRAFSIESLLHDPGSPGRVFLLDEEALLDRLSAIDAISDDRVVWSETAGLRQIIFQEDPARMDLLKILGRAYTRRHHSKAVA